MWFSGRQPSFPFVDTCVEIFNLNQAHQMKEI
jgi:hypothetical protein